MIEIKTSRELSKVRRLPEDVQENIKKALEVLDESYGKDRNAHTTGGLVVVIEREADFDNLSRYGLDFEDRVIGEYQEELDYGKYLEILILLGDDYSLLLIIPTRLKPETLIA